MIGGFREVHESVDWVTPKCSRPSESVFQRRGHSYMMLIPDMAGSSSSRESDNLDSSLADMQSVIVPPLLSIFGLVRSTELPNP